MDPLAKSDWRKDEFQERWLFTCTCPLCTGPPKEIAKLDDKREMISEAIRCIKQADALRNEPKPEMRSQKFHDQLLIQGDEVVLGELGWKALEKHAVHSGINDLKLWNRYALGVTRP